jgi:hypothetical protein
MAETDPPSDQPPDTPVAEGTKHALLTEAEFEQLVQNFKDREMKNLCELCGKSEFSIGKLIVTPMPMQYDQERGFGVLVGQAKVMPSVLLTCGHCGNQKFINILIQGLRKQHVAAKSD